MTGFLKMIALLAVLGIVVISSLFVLDIVTGEQTKELLVKVLLVLGIIALGGLGSSVLMRSR